MTWACDARRLDSYCLGMRLLFFLCRTVKSGENMRTFNKCLSQLQKMVFISFNFLAWARNP